MAFQSIAKELSEFERDFAGVLDDRDAAVRFLLQYLAGQHAGRLRPKVLLLTAGMQGGTGPESGRMALLVELLHLASLIHDDVIDNAAERRNQQTVNAVWDNKIAVLLGDYLLSKVLGLMQESALPGLLERVSSTVRQLTSGEITQLSQYNNLDLSESDYIRIVSLKTASLLETSFRLGALSAGADMVQESAYGSFGQRFGLFFQLKDDLKDYAVTSDGKGIYNDIREGNVTLPVIYTMQSLCMTERADFRRRYLQVGKSEPDLSAIAGTVRQCGALAHACGQLRQMEEELLQDCARFPASPYRDDLEYVIRETGDCGPILKL